MFDPRKAGTFSERVLQPALRREDGDRHLLGYRTTNSGMAIACGAEHTLLTECHVGPHDARSRTTWPSTCTASAPGRASRCA